MVSPTRSALFEWEATFRAALEDPVRAQTDLLATILHRHAETEIGRRYQFASIANQREYSVLPTTSYADFAPAIDRMLAGEPDVLVAGQPVFFARSSGTTGKPKHLPYSRYVSEEYRLFVGAMLGAVERQQPGIVERGMVILAQYDEDRTTSGIVIGAASGFARNEFRGLAHFDALPMAITEEPRYELRYYATLLIALSQPLRMLHAINPSTLLRLFHEAERYGDALAHDLERGTCGAGPEGVAELVARSGFPLAPRPALARRLREVLAAEGRFLPQEIWPDLTLIATWQGGNCANYLAQLAQLCPRATLRATTSGASEAALLVPLEPGWTGGVPAILSTYYEFFPADAEPTSPVPLAELEVNRGYRFCVTNQRGMYRLLMDDVFYVEDYYRSVPVLRFASRLGTSSVTGEKLTEQQVVDAMVVATQRLTFSIDEFQVAAEWATPPRYLLLLELAAPATREQLRDLLAAFETQLQAVNVEYEAKRASGRLGPPVLRLLPRGELARAMRRQQTSGRSDAQSKIPKLRLEVFREFNLTVTEETAIDE